MIAINATTPAPEDVRIPLTGFLVPRPAVSVSWGTPLKRPPILEDSLFSGHFSPQWQRPHLPATEQNRPLCFGSTSKTIPEIGLKSEACRFPLLFYPYPVPQDGFVCRCIVRRDFRSGDNLASHRGLSCLARANQGLNESPRFLQTF